MHILYVSLSNAIWWWIIGYNHLSNENLPSCQDIDKSSSEINRLKVQIETGQKMLKKLVKGIEESKKEKERLVAEKEKLLSVFKEIEQKAFTVQENYKKTQEVLYFILSFTI